mgnify:CR=1 FL=1
MKSDEFTLTRINAATAIMEDEFNCHYGNDYIYICNGDSSSILFHYFGNNSIREWVYLNRFSGYRDLFRYIRELFIKHKGDIKND